MNAVVQVGNDQLQSMDVPAPDQQVEEGDRIGSAGDGHQGRPWR
jgi:hypothetical protein